MKNQNEEKLVRDKHGILRIAGNGKFAPGISANPLGRTKRKTLTERIHEKLDSADSNFQWKDLVEAIITLSKRKDKDILKELWHYTDGMPTQRTELTGKDGEPLVIVKHGNTPIPVADNSMGR